MSITQFQVDAFASSLFKGNPAAVVILEEWPVDEVLQNIAMENNLSETVFFIPDNDEIKLRWFTPATEVNLCGHATLAAAHVIFNILNFSGETITFNSRSGILRVTRNAALMYLDFPAARVKPVKTPKILANALGHNPVECFEGGEDLLAVYSSEQIVRQIEPNYQLLSQLDWRGIVVTAKGNEADFVSRFFGPKVGIQEDPVTGSAHTALIPFWSQKLGKKNMVAHQVSKRGGILYCENLGERVFIGGQAITFMAGVIYL